MEPITGVVVPIPVPAALDRLRRRWDLAASLGMRSHITTLFPFLPLSALSPDVRDTLAAIAARVEPFDVRFERVRRWPGVVWIDPEPSQPFRTLTDALVAAWPAYPPYGGVHDEVIPHLTIVESDEAPLDEIETVALTALPFTARASTLELWREDEAEGWHPHWRLPLGGAGPA